MIRRSSYINIFKIKKNRYYVHDIRTKDDYQISSEEFFVLQNIERPTTLESLQKNFPKIEQTTLTILLEKLLFLGAIISDERNISQEYGPFVVPEGSRMFDSPREFLSANSRVAIIGLPWDFSSGQKGAVLGPEILRNASKGYPSFYSNQFMGWYSYYVQDNILSGVEIIDFGDLLAPVIADYDMIQTAANVALNIIKRLGAFPVFIGGEHGLTLPLLRVLNSEPFCLVLLDAHDDCYDSFGINHGNFVLHAIQVPNINSIYIAGVRGIVPQGNRHTLQQSGINVLTAYRWRRDGIEQFLTNIPDLPIYISVDIDILDPCYAPGTRCLKGDGLSADQVFDIVTQLGEKHKIIALDIMELSTTRNSCDYTPFYAIEIMLHLLHSALKGRP